MKKHTHKKVIINGMMAGVFARKRVIRANRTVSWFDKFCAEWRAKHNVKPKTESTQDSLRGIQESSKPYTTQGLWKYIK